MKANIRRVGTVLVLGFVLVALSLIYWQVLRASELTSDVDLNRYRLAQREKTVQRGRILDRNGVIVASSKIEPDGVDRVYSQPWLVHVTGFHNLIFGDANVERKFGNYLSGAVESDPLRRLFDSLLHRPTAGDDVVLTVDSALQRVAEEELGAAKGAIVVIQPNTGEILALASHPYFDPNTMERDWQRLRNDPDRPLLNRATQGLYVPGSTFKTVTLAAVLEEGISRPDEVFDFEMKVDSRGRDYHTDVVNGFPIVCYNHGPTSPGRAILTLADAYAKSCNVVFARLGLRLGAQRLAGYARRFGFEAPIPVEIPTEPSSVSAQPDFLNDQVALASTAFGQGQLQVTPLQLALVAAAIANDGKIPQPHLVREIRTRDVSIKVGPMGVWREAISPATARMLAQIMVESVDNGWASPAQIRGVAVAGKTGTAEAQLDDLPHAWFIGFAPADEPKVAVAVVKENVGSGGAEAAPAARRLMELVLRK
ncbi:MAG: penicillin-binding protein 2 [Chloroflexi bacterium]|nr:penicillin-binding protein 2 [Chloroflexota bacterium]